MMKTKALFASLILLASGAIALGQSGMPAEKLSIAQVFDRGVTGVEKEFVSAAEAMPEDKYSFRPTSGEFKGVRTFGEQVKHVAAVNYMLGAAILEEKPPVDVAGESGPDAIKSKAEIVQFLKDSFAYVHKAIATINDGNQLAPIKMPWGKQMGTRVGMSTIVVSHCFDHYGQMAVYLRMNGIVPPASRG